MLAIVMETGYKVSWEKTYLVQNKIKCLGVDLDGKAVFAGVLLETCSQIQTINGAWNLPERGWSILHKPLNPKTWNSLQKRPHWHFSNDCDAASQLRGSTGCASVDSANTVNMGVKVLCQQEGCEWS